MRDGESGKNLASTLEAQHPSVISAKSRSRDRRQTCARTIARDRIAPLG
ncbi:hypothetical protein QT971_00410 [Microcoleus sp. herbarium19]